MQYFVNKYVPHQKQLKKLLNNYLVCFDTFYIKKFEGLKRNYCTNQKILNLKIYS